MKHMATQTDTIRPAKLFELQQEVDILRSAVISVIGKDDEGDYNPQFVKDMFKAVGEKPTRSFKNVKSFLSELART